ncbi:MAG: hypothetical protein COV29_02760 [Candidatus Yanofskybacteria bacterium CG10_big_fil_rev_8_21_14_0_10_36_16]|uniref:Uncharacterized protein n=1 Tax=Candidatus Yanofskybacteria bacterium CG10_big_fil_rev_8_21_14_0_10_36_16 TaxID=1975096 RepID=A0A2J0Q7U9_9BACT|nr:MAG: hypothetical protein COV29_02760 [Candidatus Yanofskybacteria bacterium CG10_big_fil_rev_8_21_14_0_10_36_16]
MQKEARMKNKFVSLLLFFLIFCLPNINGQGVQSSEGFPFLAGVVDSIDHDFSCIYVRLDIDKKISERVCLDEITVFASKLTDQYILGYDFPFFGKGAVHSKDPHYHKLYDETEENPKWRDKFFLKKYLTELVQSGTHVHISKRKTTKDVNYEDVFKNTEKN